MSRHQNLQALRAWLQEKDPGTIDITAFNNNALEAADEALSEEKEMGSKSDSNKGQDKPPVWDGNVLKLGTGLKIVHLVGIEEEFEGCAIDMACHFKGCYAQHKWKFN